MLSAENNSFVCKYLLNGPGKRKSTFKVIDILNKQQVYIKTIHSTCYTINFSRHLISISK